MNIFNHVLIDSIINKFKKRPLVIPAFAGVLFMLLTMSYGIAVSIIVLAVLVTLLFYRDTRFRTIVFCSIVFLLYLIVQFYCSGITNSDITNLRISNVEFKVVDVEDKLDGSSKVILYNRNYGRVLMNEYSSSRPALWSRIILNGILYIPEEPANPGEFNYRKYIKQQGIHYIVRGSEYSYCELNEISILHNVFSNKINSYKSYLVDVFCNKELAGAMFLGDTSLIDSDTKNQFKHGNMSHLLAVSGTHFSGFMAMVPFIFSKIRSKKLSRGLYFSIVCLIVCITGASASVIRAAFISCCSFVSRDKISGVSLAAIILGILMPFTLVSIGFLMSFVLCLSIICLSGYISDRLEKNLCSDVSSTISVVIAAQIGMIPFWTLISPKIGLIRLILQFVASFFAQICCTIFFPSVLLFQMFTWIVFPCDLLLILIQKIANISSHAPFVINTKGVSFLLTITLLAFSIYLVIPNSVYRFILKKTVFILLTAVLVCRFCNYYLQPKMEVIFIDVGQGDSILVVCDNISVLIDAGSYDKGETVASVLDYYGISVPTYTVVTHWDEDHCGGIKYLYENGRTGKIYSSYTEEDVEGVEIIKAGDCISIGDARLICINPDTQYDDSNDKSVVLDLSCNGCNMLFTGDIPCEIESELIDKNRLRDVDVLKVAHHGSRYSSSEEFLDVIKPEIAIISVGKYNDYGHPSDEVLQRLEGVQIYETSKSGAVIVDIYENRYEIDSYRSQAMITKDSNVC